MKSKIQFMNIYFVSKLFSNHLLTSGTSLMEKLSCEDSDNEEDP